MDCGPRACLNFVEFFWDNIKTFAFIKYAIVASLSKHLKFISFVTTVPLVTVVVRITSAQHVAEILCPRSGNSLTTVSSHILTLPNKILANVISVYVNNLPFVIWLRIPSFISLSICQRHNLPPERCITNTFTPQTHISFPNIC